MSTGSAQRPFVQDRRCAGRRGGHVSETEIRAAVAAERRDQVDLLGSLTEEQWDTASP